MRASKKRAELLRGPLPHLQIHRVEAVSDGARFYFDGGQQVVACAWVDKTHERCNDPGDCHDLERVESPRSPARPWETLGR